MPVSLSTAWNAWRHSDGYSMLFEIKELGFGDAELSFNIGPDMIQGIKRAVDEGLIRISSIHNTCPTPDGLPRFQALPDHYSMSSAESDKRALAVKFAKKSLDTARLLGARVLVLHCGRVEIPDRTRQMIELADAGLLNSREFQEIRTHAILERERASAPFLENTLRSLEEISDYAKVSGILLGIENRFYYREIPAFDEIAVILDKLKGANLFYWHDTGHAQIMNALGLGPPQKESLAAFGDSIIGFHLHDVSGLKDHLAPSKGTIDFKIFSPYLKKDVIKVIEAHSPADTIDIDNSRKMLVSLCQDECR